MLRRVVVDEVGRERGGELGRVVVVAPDELDDRPGQRVDWLAEHAEHDIDPILDRYIRLYIGLLQSPGGGEP